MWLVWACPGCFVVFGFIFASIPAFFALHFRRKAAALADMSPTKIADLKPGPAKVKARVVAQEELLSSPMGRKECVYYHFIVEERQQISGGRIGPGGSASAGAMDWVPVVEDKQSIDVTLEDDTGQAEIDLRDAEIVGKSAEKTSSVFEDPPERLQSLLRNRYGTKTRGLLLNKTMSFTETALADGAKVVVVGEVEEGRSGRLVFRRGAVPLIVSDKGKKGLAAPYRRKEMYCWLGAGFLLFAGLMLALIFGLAAANFAADADKRENSGGAPGAGREVAAVQTRTPAVL